MATQSKKRIHSKTYWVFIPISVLAVITELANNTLFKEFLGDHVTWVILLLSITAKLLREYTSVPLEGNEPPKLNPLEEALRQDDIAIKDI